ncbi:MAG TPA: DNRLRE domain-containing protein [Verrucomicrobiae bacterium]|nr:DNRLRE domain-containing protein [Verrucomicrobiae bacterium]
MNVRLLMACLWFLVASSVTAQVVLTNYPVADTFVRSLDPTHNYGGAGALSVSGLIATNVIGQQAGLLDSFLRFDVSGVASNFNSIYGAGRWGISSVTLVVFEQTDVNNTDFNGGVGPFEIRWIATNTWTEGTGKPNNPTTDGIVYNDEPSLLNSNLDKSLGTFVNGGTNGVVRLSLGASAGFVSNLSTGNLVSLFLTATTNSTVGFTFHSRNFIDPSQFPFLEITAIPIPQITSLVVVGSDVKIGFITTNNISYSVEYSTNLVTGSWNPLTNGIAGTGGIVTVTDSGAATAPQRFYKVGAGY